LYEQLSETAAEACRVRLQTREQSGLTQEMEANWAFLVAHSELERFRQQVDALSGEGNLGGLLLRMSGPWPPYSFAPRLDGGE